jgi:hypothetical protein
VKFHSAAARVQACDWPLLSGRWLLQWIGSIAAVCVSGFWRLLRVFRVFREFRALHMSVQWCSCTGVQLVQ